MQLNGVRCEIQTHLVWTHVSPVTEFGSFDWAQMKCTCSIDWLRTIFIFFFWFHLTSKQWQLIVLDFLICDEFSIWPIFCPYFEIYELRFTIYIYWIFGSQARVSWFFFFSLFFSTHANAQNTATFYRQISFDRIEQSTHTFAHQSSRMKWFTHALHVPRIIEFDLRKLGMIPIWMCIRCDTTFTQYAVKQSARFIPYTKTISSHLIDFCNRKCLLSATAFLFWSTEIYLVCWKMKHLWLTLVRRRSAVENHKRIRMWRVCCVLKRTFLRRMAMEWNRNA